MSRHSGNVYVYGGSDVNEMALNTVERNDSALGWTLMPTQMFTADTFFASLSLP
jgi:hypothetical protein